MVKLLMAAPGDEVKVMKLRRCCPGIREEIVGGKMVDLVAADAIDRWLNAPVRQTAVNELNRRK